MDDEFDGLCGSLLAAADVLEAVLQEVDAAALCQLKAASVAWCAHARRELCNRLWIRLCRREGQPEPAGVDSITDLDVECLNEAGRPWEVVVAGRQLPQLARLHGYGFVVDVQAVREADLEEEHVVEEEEDDDDDDEEEEDDDDDSTLGGVALRSCIQGEGQPPNELLLAAVACAAPGTVRGVPVQLLREGDAIDELELRYSRIGVTEAKLLGLMLPAATAVRSLNLANNRLCLVSSWKTCTYTTEGITKLCEALKGSAVTSLNIRDNRIGDEGAFVLAAILKETQITNLNIAANYIGAEGASALAAVLKETQITTLRLAVNKLCGLDFYGQGVGGHGNYTAKGITKLCEALKGSAVTSLDLWNNYIRVEGGSALAAVLRETKITTLDLADNELCGVNYEANGIYTAEGINKLCEGLKGSAVTSLSLQRNALGPKGAAALAEGLKGNSTLQSLDIGGNCIGAEGASALAAILKETQITTLSLERNQLCGLNGSGEGTYTAEGITKLCEALKGSAMTSLKLQRNHLFPEGAATLAEGLKGNSTLQTLKLGGNEIWIDGASAIAAVLKKTQITNLDIRDNRIGDEGAFVLAAILKETQITNLNLEYNGLTNEAKQALQDAAGSSVRINF